MRSEFAANMALQDESEYRARSKGKPSRDWKQAREQKRQGGYMAHMAICMIAILSAIVIIWK